MVSGFHVKISPTIIPMLLVLLDVFSFKEIKSGSSGQKLWIIAAEKNQYLDSKVQTLSLSVPTRW